MKRMLVPYEVHEVRVHHDDRVIQKDMLERWMNDLQKVIFQLASGDGTDAEKNAMYMVAKVLTKLTHHFEQHDDVLTLDNILNTVADDNDVDIEYILPF